MWKINWPKWALLAGALAAWLTWCGWGWGSSETVKNHAPELKVPSTVAMYEKTKKVVDNIICSDPDKDPVKIELKSSNWNLGVSYDQNSSSLELDASSWNLADWVNEEVDVNVTCSDWKLNTTETIKVTVQDSVNDALLSYSTDIPDEVYYKWDLNWSIVLSDSDGLSSSSYEFYLIDWDNNVVYTWTMEDNESNWTYNFSIDLSSLDLPVWTYQFKTESIDPVIGWENPQDPIVISHTVQLKWVLTLDWPTSWDDGSSYEIDLGIDWYDINDLTFRVRWSYDENWDWQDYDEEISLWGTAIWWNVALSNDWVFTIDTTNTWYWDGTSMWSWDWVEIEAKAPDWTTVIHRFTVN